MSIRILSLALVVLMASAMEARGASLYAGASMVSITPDRPVALDGQLSTRISQGVESELTASALALESRDGDRVAGQALFVACDLVAIWEGLPGGGGRVRECRGGLQPGCGPLWRAY